MLELGISMDKEEWPLVMDKPIELDKWPIAFQNFNKFTLHFRGIYEIHLKLIKEIMKDDHNIYPLVGLRNIRNLID